MERPVRAGGPAAAREQYLPRWLIDHGVAPRGTGAPPAGGITIRRPLRDMAGPEERYLYELARQFRVA